MHANFVPRDPTYSGADNFEDQWNTISLPWTIWTVQYRNTRTLRNFSSFLAPFYRKEVKITSQKSPEKAQETTFYPSFLNPTPYFNTTNKVWKRDENHQKTSPQPTPPFLGWEWKNNKYNLFSADDFAQSKLRSSWKLLLLGGVAFEALTNHRAHLICFPGLQNQQLTQLWAHPFPFAEGLDQLSAHTGGAPRYLLAASPKRCPRLGALTSLPFQHFQTEKQLDLLSYMSS